MFLRLLLLFTIGAATVNAQNIQSGDWYTGKNSKGTVYTYTSGQAIQNSTANVDLTFYVDSESNMYFYIDNAALYNYDSTGNKNRVDVHVIVDNGQKFRMYGEITSKGYVYISGIKNGASVQNMLDKMKAGSNIYIQTKGSGAPKVFKFSLSGFTQALSNLDKLYNQIRNDNPFTSANSDNPFKG